MNGFTSKRDLSFFESDEFIIEGLKIPDTATAKELTAKISNLPGSVGIVIPMNYNLSLAVRKGLCGAEGFGKKYLYMQALYRKAFENLLLESTSLQEFEDRLKNSELDFVPLPEKWQGFYQMYSTWGLQFIYLCSNLPIERLNEDDLALLQAMVESGKADISAELTEMVKRTFSDVTLALPCEEDDVFCGYGRGGNIAPNRSVVLEMDNNVFDENGEFRDYSRNAARDDYLEELAQEMQQTLSEQLGHRVIVQVH